MEISRILWSYGYALDTQTVYRSLRLLKRSGLITSTPDGERSHVCLITPKGLRTYRNTKAHIDLLRRIGG